MKIQIKNIHIEYQEYLEKKSFIYVDKLADKDVRHSAQTVFGIIIFGGGPVIGGWLSGCLQNMYTSDNIFDYSKFWYTLSAIGFITLIFFYLTIFTFIRIIIFIPTIAISFN